MFKSHQKASNFASIFHSIFMFFPNPLPEGIFGGPKCRFMLKSAILGQLPIFREPQNGPLERHFRAKRSPKSKLFCTGSLPEPTWARHATQNGPRTHFHRFWMDFGWSFMRCWMIFACFFNDCSYIFGINSGIVRIFTEF